MGSSAPGRPPTSEANCFGCCRVCEVQSWCCRLADLCGFDLGGPHVWLVTQFALHLKYDVPRRMGCAGKGDEGWTMALSVCV